MPPVAASDVDVPAEWRDKVNILLQIWQKKQRQHGRNSSILGAISLFDGTPRDWRLSACLQQAGVPCVSIDVRNSLDQDILSETGRDYFLGCLMKLAPNSLLWMAPECSTWIWLNRVHNQRSLDRPQGELTSSSVHQANQTAAFVARALKLATSRGQVLGVRSAWLALASAALGSSISRLSAFRIALLALASVKRSMATRFCTVLSPRTTDA